MGRQRRIIPEFMVNNRDDTFRIILPLKLKLDFDNYGNSHFNVIVKNETTGEHSLQEMSPELLFTHYSTEKYFVNGKENTRRYTKEVYEDTFFIDTNVNYKLAEVKIKNLLSEVNIVSLLGWKRKFLAIGKNIHCYHLQSFGKNIIIPHYAIAVYYYFRSTKMREAALNCRLDDLYVGCDCNKDEATIILKERTNDIDAAFIHRFACQDNAGNAFDDIGKYINAYLRVMDDKYPDDPKDTIPIKAKFPVKGKFNLEARVSKLTNEDTGIDYYYVHEILNDTSDIGFKKFKKLTQKDSVITEIDDDLGNLPVLQKEIPDETTEILKIDDASRKLTRNEVATNRKKPCGSLAGINIESEDLTKEETVTILKIYEESANGQAVDQSLTESSSNGKESIRKTVVSNSAEEEPTEASMREYTHNFDEFNKYTAFLQTQSIIKNFKPYGNQEMKQVIDKDTKKINTKCRLHKRARQYITATFEYNNLFVGLLELENGNRASVGTWVIVSRSPVDNNTFDAFLDLYTKKNLHIPQIKEKYKQNPNLKFTVKYHEKIEDLRKDDLMRWSAGLVGKINI
jgi:hypothetical protein